VPDLINVNGRVDPPGTAAISPLDRGFLYGDSVYETVRAYGGVPFRLAAHLDRLRRSAARLEIDCDAAPVAVETETLRTLAAAGEPEAAIRIVVTRGPGPIGYDVASCGPPTVVVYVRRRPELPRGWREEGVDVAIVATRRNAPDALDPAIKSGNLLNNFLAWREASRLRAWEPVLLNAQGRVAEGATSNVFAVRDGRLLTPPLDEGILEGVTRAAVLEVARADGIPVGEAALAPDDFRRADEAFLTSTLKGVVPIRRCDGWPIRHGRPGPITLRVLALFEACVQAETKIGSAPGSTRR
jgi:branched-chain amino acid aminotransferase